MYTYKCRVIRVVDGDTVILEIDLGFHIKIERSVRLLGYNAPEIFGKKSLLEIAGSGLRSKEQLEKILLESKNLLCKTELDKTDKYGRVLATLYANENDLTVNDRMKIFVEQFNTPS